MIPRLSQYERVVGKRAIRHIRERAEPLRGKHVVHLNATSSGGGVAEILNTLVFLMNDLGIDTGWRIMLGSHSFFKVTKGMHNALQGEKRWRMTQSRQRLYNEYSVRNGLINHMRSRDFVVIHDPQPLAMIDHYPLRTGRWFWRCHIDLSHPNGQTLSFLKPYIRKYDGIIISSRQYRVRGVRLPHHLIYPSIDPLSPKNRRLSRERARLLLAKHGISLDRPIIAQVSRFDPWKDPLGLLAIYKEIRKHADCQLVLMGDMAADDPQGPIIYHKVRQQAERLEGVTLITEKNDLLVNALQQEATIVFQNSKREGFALTVSEALWKGTPVIASPVGGIPFQVKHGRTGYLIRSRKEGVKHALRLLRDERLRRKLGAQGREHVKKHFLITRHLLDYVELFRAALPAAGR